MKLITRGFSKLDKESDVCWIALTVTSGWRWRKSFAVEGRASLAGE